MDTNTGTLVSICEWVLKWRHFANKTSHIDIEEDKDATTYMKQVCISKIILERQLGCMPVSVQLAHHCVGNIVSLPFYQGCALWRAPHGISCCC